MDVEGGWYHVMGRGTERRALFEDKRDHEHFLELLEKATERYRILIHAHVELVNHYHLVIQTPEGNLSRGMQWLNVSYAAWFNRRHDRVGPLFQGRFKSVPVENGAWAYELSLYVHLNPVMTTTYGLGKLEKGAESVAISVPDRETVTRRLTALRQYPWSSYPAYAGYRSVPPWLTMGEILSRAAGPQAERAWAYRKEARNRLSKGVEPELKERLRDGFALGSEAFRKRVRDGAAGGREIAGTRELRARVTWEEAIRLVERVRGEPADRFLGVRGDWGRPLLLWTARRFGGLTLKEVGSHAGGMDYTAVAMAIKRFEARAQRDRRLGQAMQRIESEM